MKASKYEIPEDLLYTQEHEWARIVSPTEVVVGITDYAADMLHDVVFVILPAVGGSQKRGSSVASVESVKSTSDVMAPLSGEVLAVNDALAQHPEKVNQSPYGEGWFFKVRPSALESESGGLLTPAAYADLVARLADV
ncbi:MAG: glycine cleavage system protein GcvH [Nitrososphaerota archaeon]|nr:glycine cleavage system protein GcvH [Nitrososphaerota archaeon]